MKSKKILIAILLICSFLIISIYFRYRGNSWPLGIESFWCLIAFIALTGLAIIMIIWINKSNIYNRHIAAGLFIGLLWIIEILINNLFHPGLPIRDYIDNAFWIVISVFIFIYALKKSRQAKTISQGVVAGFWAGFSSGAVACLTALMLIVFGMKYILLDPLNIKEWMDVKSASTVRSMSIYFAYETLAGAFIHLFVLGIVYGIIAGLIAGFLGRIISTIK